MPTIQQGGGNINFPGLPPPTTAHGWIEQAQGKIAAMIASAQKVGDLVLVAALTPVQDDLTSADAAAVTLQNQVAASQQPQPAKTPPTAAPAATGVYVSGAAAAGIAVATGAVGALAGYAVGKRRK
jgi:hypothetical protein